ncbi:MAG: prepilin-type N-terminal cleavage/methylation domain-containing protein [Synergistaceae bacterium]|nr:prepilin-type N-terminal cleavage/methylation domain-containing protein [Synergistaceae bacterium]
MRKTRRAAFTLIEMLVSLVIAAIVGGVFIEALWIFYGLFFQTNDYTIAREEMELAVQGVGREMGLVALGMPNNQEKKGSFAASFAGANFAGSPIMARMGEASADWGGPVTVGQSNPNGNFGEAYVFQQKTPDDTILSGRKVYHGPELYYAYAVPTGVKAWVTQVNGYSPFERPAVVKNGDEVGFRTDGGSAGMNALTAFNRGGRDIGIVSNTPLSSRSWILFPTLRIPMLVTDIGPAEMTARIAPHSAAGSTKAVELESVLSGLDEVHLVQAARVFLDSTRHELVQVLFGSDYKNSSANDRRVLARDIVGLYFLYEPETRLLTMYVAARGQQAHPTAGAGVADGWPGFADPLPADALQRRVIVHSVTWRIRN